MSKDLTDDNNHYLKKAYDSNKKTLEALEPLKGNVQALTAYYQLKEVEATIKELSEKFGIDII